MANRYVRSKRWGRDVENRALSVLKGRWPSMRRTGSVAYTKDAADLVTPDKTVVVQVKGRQQTWVGQLMRGLMEANPEAALYFVVTQDKHSAPLITLDLGIFTKIVSGEDVWLD